MRHFYVSENDVTVHVVCTRTLHDQEINSHLYVPLRLRRPDKLIRFLGACVCVCVRACRVAGLRVQ